MLLAGMVWVLGPGARWWLEHVDRARGLTGKDLADALDAVRGRMLAVATGMLATVAIYYTARNADTARRTLQLTEQGQVTERYTRAVEQLGSVNLDIRLGGIYALERIARDSARDHATVMEVLAAFVREHSHDPDARGDPRQDGATGQARFRMRPDLQAALTVICRRGLGYGHTINLIGADLTWADLHGARLGYADLAQAKLVGAFLGRANLHSARLFEADLTRADLGAPGDVPAVLQRPDLARRHSWPLRRAAATSMAPPSPPAVHYTHPSQSLLKFLVRPIAGTQCGGIEAMYRKGAAVRRNMSSRGSRAVTPV
jgi:Pentapeptide repeats (8 copies)